MAKISRRPGRPRAGSTSVPTSERILATAATLFLERGYEQLTTDEIAQRCDVTKAMVYYYFSTKPNLFAEAMIWTMGRARQELERLLAQTMPLYDRLLQAMQMYIRDVHMNTNYTEALGAQIGLLSQAQIDAMRVAKRQLHEPVTVAFVEAAADGMFVAEDMPMLVEAFFGLMDAGCSLWKERSWVEQQAGDLATQLMTLFWRGAARCPEEISS